MQAMNHLKNLRAGPAEMPFQNWYTANHFLRDFCHWEIKNTTRLSNEPGILQSCAENQILENNILGTGF